MKKIKIEFFHDVICSFCFPMSYRMRQIAKNNPDVEIIHRSFALVQEAINFKDMFGSREEAKEEILSHWASANENDDLHRFNIEGMRQQDFLFPVSMPGLYACKAAHAIGGDELYWDVFDALQNALFVKNKNVELDSTIFECIKDLKIDFENWKRYYQSPEIKAAVAKDLELGNSYNIHSVPSLVIDQKYLVSGAQPYDSVQEVINKVRSEKE